GCNIGCYFCESGTLKKIRNLEPNEMVAQILAIESDLNIRISHVVLMGIGEPFDNYDNVIKFINIINHPKGIDIGARHITVSTSGLVPKIESFINDGKQVNLAISLHAPNDKIRNELMPINKVYNLSLLIKTIRKYIDVTNRRVTIEYIMLKGINDSIDNAHELSRLLKGINCYVNLIPYNETSNSKFKKSSEENVMKFYDILKQNKINVTIRKEYGSNLLAACGQLRANYKEDQ
ncbi:MAG: 23S rRNA (adenine(2503)-C(2))-methyltransferase RlmN, partial [Bacilli bacterium]|nr:23S rRNA (adenine(2503)-C(2))-methyltransferase RlmN [Bacilli bacterium]